MGEIRESYLVAAASAVALLRDPAVAAACFTRLMETKRIALIGEVAGGTI